MFSLLFTLKIILQKKRHISCTIIHVYEHLCVFTYLYILILHIYTYLYICMKNCLPGCLHCVRGFIRKQELSKGENIKNAALRLWSKSQNWISRWKYINVRFYQCRLNFNLGSTYSFSSSKDYKRRRERLEPRLKLTLVKMGINVFFKVKFCLETNSRTNPANAKYSNGHT